MKLRKIFTLSLAALALAGCADDKFAFDRVIGWWRSFALYTMRNHMVAFIKEA